MRRHQPALLGGLFIGVLSSLPVVGAANACCCLWVVVGGVLTAYLQQQDATAESQAADAALGGLVAGVIGAVIYILATSLLFSVSGDVMQAQFQAAIAAQDIPSELRDRLNNLLIGRNMLLFMGAITLPVYAVFSMLGALLGFAWFRKKTAKA